LADKNGWKGWALAVVTALLVGGGGVGLFSNAAIQALEVKHDDEIKLLEEKHEKDTKEAKSIRDRDYDVIMEMSRVIVRIDTNAIATMELVKEINRELRER